MSTDLPDQQFLDAEEDSGYTLEVFDAETDPIYRDCGCLVTGPRPCVEIHGNYCGAKKFGIVLSEVEFRRFAEWSAKWLAENPRPGERECAAAGQKRDSA